MFGYNLAVKGMFVIVPATVLAQVAGSALPELSWLNQIRDSGLVGALLIAVYALWKSREGSLAKVDLVRDAKDQALLEKDKQLFSMMEHVTATLTSHVETNRELRAIIEESVKSKGDLKFSIDALTQSLREKPCLADENILPRRR